MRLWVVIVAGLGLAAIAGAEPTPVDRICAVVADDVILESEVLDRVRLELLQSGRRPASASGSEIRALSAKVLKTLIDDRLLLEVAKAESLVVTAQEVDDRLQRQVEQIRSRFPSEESFHEQLASEGTNERELRNQLRKQMYNYAMGERVYQSLGQKTTVSFREVEAFFRANADSMPEIPASVTISFIQMTAQPGPSEVAAARGLLEDVEDRLESGEKFEDIAREVSQDPGSARDGGNLGWFGRGLMVPEFEAAAFSLQPGEVSDIVETPFGLHIIRMEEVRAEEIRARHILVRVPLSEESGKAIRDTLLSLKERSMNGEEFGLLTREYSEMGKEGQGIRVSILAENMPLPFATAVSTAEAGDVAEPFEGDAGVWFLVKLHSRTAKHSMNLSDDRQALEENVMQRKLSEKLENLLEKQRAETYIDKRCSYDNAP